MGDTNLDHLHPDLRVRWVAFRDGPWGRQNGVYLLSGYRSTARQAVLYARYIASGRNRKYLAAPPGGSNHEDTLYGRPAATAIDIHPTSGDYVGMHRMARAYGLHFPLWHGGQSEIMHAEVDYSIPFRGGGPAPAPAPRPAPEEDDLKPDERAALLRIDDALNRMNPRDPGLLHILKNQTVPQVNAASLVLLQLQKEILEEGSNFWKRHYDIRDRLTERVAKIAARAAVRVLKELGHDVVISHEELS